MQIPQRSRRAQRAAADTRAIDARCALFCAARGKLHVRHRYAPTMRGCRDKSVISTAQQRREASRLELIVNDEISRVIVERRNTELVLHNQRACRCRRRSFGCHRSRSGDARAHARAAVASEPASAETDATACATEADASASARPRDVSPSAKFMPRARAQERARSRGLFMEKSWVRSSCRCFPEKRHVGAPSSSTAASFCLNLLRVAFI